MSSEQKTIEKLAIFGVWYFLVSQALGFYGNSCAYYPSAFTENIAKWASLVFFIVGTFAFLLFILFGEGIESKNVHPVKKWLFYLFGVPAMGILFTSMHYIALSQGLPTLASKLFLHQREAIVEVTSKRIGSRQKNFYATIYGLGLEQEFPVTQEFYLRAEEGKKLLINIRQSEFGIELDI